MANRRTIRILTIIGGTLTALGLLAVPASAAGNAKGHLILNNQGTITKVAPGQAVQQAAAACVGAADAVAVNVDAVRAAFPNPVQVCTVAGKPVTLTSQVPATEA